MAMSEHACCLTSTFLQRIFGSRIAAKPKLQRPHLWPLPIMEKECYDSLVAPIQKIASEAIEMFDKLVESKEYDLPPVFHYKR